MMTKVGESAAEPATDGHDGVSGSPATGRVEDISGKSGGGESGGGAYPNQQTGKSPAQGGFFGHGGQTVIAYHGSAAGPAVNAATDGAPDGDVIGRHSVCEQPTINAEGRSFSEIEIDGTAIAERSINPSENDVLRGNTPTPRDEQDGSQPIGSRPNNREVENEMAHAPVQDGKPPRPATGPPAG